MLEKILSNKINYLFILSILLLFLSNNSLILNFPTFLNTLLIIFFYICIFSVSYLKNKKIKKNNTFLESSVLTLFIYIVFRIIINFWIVEVSKSSKIETTILPIENFIAGRSNLVFFYFKDKRYSLRYNNHLSKDELINHHKIKIYYSKSLIDTYVVKKYNIIAK